MSGVLERVFRFSQVFRAYPFCHSRPDRSFSYQGRYFGLCARCTTMYIGGLMAVITAPFWQVRSSFVMLVVGSFLLVPGGVDGVTQMFGRRESTNRLRAVTGLLLGVGGVVFAQGAAVALL